MRHIKLFETLGFNKHLRTYIKRDINVKRSLIMLLDVHQDLPKTCFFKLDQVLENCSLQSEREMKKPNSCRDIIH